MKNAPFEVPVQLSSNARKRLRFSQEAYFQEAYYQLLDVFGGVPDDLASVAFIVFKPDAAPSRCVERCLNALDSFGVFAIGAFPFTFSRHSIRELWRYELNVSTRERYPGIDSFLMSSESLLMVLKSETESATTLCEFLQRIKGPTEIADRKADQLRSIIGAPAGTLNYIHLPDEPADFIREIGVLFDEKERFAIFKCVKASKAMGRTIEVPIRQFYGNIDRCSLHIEDVIAAMTRQHAIEPLVLDELLKFARESVNFDEVGRRVKAFGLSLSYWQLVTLFVSGREFVVQGCKPVLEIEAERSHECRF
jgi:hypothetical protein